MLAEHGGQGFGPFKTALGEALVETLHPISERLTRLLDDRAAIESILADGAERARAIAVPTLAKAFDALGLVRN